MEANLKRLMHSLNHTITAAYQILLFQKMFLVAFYGFFRVGELTTKTPERRHSVLQFQSQSFLKSRNEVQAAKLVITDYKHNTTGRPFSIIIHRESTVHCCPVDSLRSRRLEVAGERENGRARGRHARGEGAPARKAPENRFNSHSVSADISNWSRGSRGKN